MPASVASDSAIQTAPAAAAPAPIGLVRSLIETTKPGITRLVTITASVGFVVSASQHTWTTGKFALAFLGASIGTALSASGANALNQVLERDRDAVMNRTCKRPLPTDRVAPRSVTALGLILGTLGVAVLWATVGWVPAALSLACLLVYVLIYTPMKPLTPWATFVGTIPGALPPLIGWTAASQVGGLASLREPGGWSLFLLMTIWQIPHFLAIAWMYRDDYAKAGYRVLPVLERGEERTIFTIAAWSVLLMPATVVPGLLLTTLGWPYIAVAILTGLAFLVLVARLLIRRGRAEARAVFLGSVIHLPLLLVAMVATTIAGVAF